jgi:tRNA nucleotidyltransferase (CCA-adding enzyme)
MDWPPHVRVYTVGGAVRDQLLGLPVKDRDYVVVGASPEEMNALGFRPVGRDFPVFLHPVTHEEYALARTERKTARGYKGFQVYAATDVSLEEDLLRRDLTINAMALDAHNQLIDPYGGREDLAAKRFRHVSPAFAEDPLRILRVARFAARFSDFAIADDTLQLMRGMVMAGEIEALVPERVWQELSRGLMEARPARMLQVLQSCGALARLLPELDRLFGVPQPPQHHPEIDTGVHVLMVVDQAAALNLSLPARFAALLHDLGKGTTPADILPRHHGHEGRSADLARQVCARLKAPADCRDLAILVAREHGVVHRAQELRAETILRLFERCDAWRRPERFRELLAACQADYQGRGGYQQRPYPQAERLNQALQAGLNVDAGALARQCSGSQAIARAIRAARIANIESVIGRRPAEL